MALPAMPAPHACGERRRLCVCTLVAVHCSCMLPLHGVQRLSCALGGGAWQVACSFKHRQGVVMVFCVLAGRYLAGWFSRHMWGRALTHQRLQWRGFLECCIFV